MFAGLEGEEGLEIERSSRGGKDGGVAEREEGGGGGGGEGRGGEL